MSLEIIIWDVNHGNSASIKLPNGKILMLDCAANPVTEFSPIYQTKRHWGHLDCLNISHPHLDHISDILNIDYMKPDSLERPFIDHDRLREGKDGEALEIINKYIDFESSFSYDAPPEKHPHYTEWSDDVEINDFRLDGEHEDLNDYSSVTFLSYGSFHFAYGADLSSGGWDKLIDQEGSKFKNKLAKVNFFEASHHGRENGFSPQIFSKMKPRLVLISDKEVQDTSVTGRYHDYCLGWPVINQNEEETNDRYVLTTRSDGRIKISVDIVDQETRVEVKTLYPDAS